jgi:hypothetical protein
MTWIRTQSFLLRIRLHQSRVMKADEDLREGEEHPEQVDGAGEISLCSTRQVKS